MNDLELMIKTLEEKHNTETKHARHYFTTLGLDRLERIIEYLQDYKRILTELKREDNLIDSTEGLK